MVSENIRRSQKLPKAIRPEEFKQLISAIPTEKKILRTAFLLGYGSGLRVSEIIKLTPVNITDKIFIEQAKNLKDRIVPLPKGWRLWMKDLLPLKVSARTLERQFNSYKNKLEFNPSYTLHSLRHGFGTRLLESGVPLNQVQILMGHSNISTTNVYVRANPIDALKNYERLF